MVKTKTDRKEKRNIKYLKKTHKKYNNIIYRDESEDDGNTNPPQCKCNNPYNDITQHQP